jgi:signal transduction histidine kinase
MTESTVLLINDLPDQLELFGVFLRRLGYHVVPSADARSALSLARDVNVDLVVSDVMMPGMTGIELCRRMRADERLRSAPILLLSALRKDSQSVVEGIEAGADDYLEIPFEVSVLAAKAAALVERGRLTRTLERRVAERTSQLEEAYRELETFSYSVSHDLRAPLACVGNYLRRIERKLDPATGEECRELLQLASEQIGAATEMIADLLDYARLVRAEPRLREVDLGALVGEVIAELTPASAAGRAVEWRVGELPRVQADPSLLKLAVCNLLDNALKYTRPRVVAEIEVGARDVGAEIVIFVRDNGVGFDPACAERVFEVFQRLHRDEEFEGTGVGLANVERVARRHGGRVWAEGAVGAGATFHLALPRAAPAGLARATAHEAG